MLYHYKNILINTFNIVNWRVKAMNLETVCSNLENITSYNRLTGWQHSDFRVLQYACNLMPWHLPSFMHTL